MTRARRNLPQPIDQPAELRLIGARPSDAALARDDLALALDTLADACLVVDDAWRCRYANAAALRLLDVAPRDLPGSSLWALFGGASDTSPRRELQQARDGGAPVTFEWQQPDGAWFDVSAVPLPAGLSIFMRDVTDHKLALQRMRAAEGQYQTLIEQVPAAVYTEAVDPGHRDIYMSPQIERLTGYGSTEWLSEPSFWKRITHPDDLERVQLEVERTDLSGAPYRMEYRLITRDGRIIWIRNEALLARDAAGHPLYWQGFIFDITEQKLAEQALREAETKYCTLVEQIPAVTYIEDASTGFSYTSPQVELLTGYTPAEWQSSPYFYRDVAHPDDQPLVQAEIERTDATGEPFSLEYRCITRDGRTIWVQNESILLRDEDGQPRVWQGFIVDITERKHAETALREAERKYRTLVEQIPAITYRGTAHEPYVTTYISPQLEVVLGYTPSEWLDDPDLWMDRLHPDDRERVISTNDDSNTYGAPYHDEYRVIAKDGRVVWIYDEARLVCDEAGRPIGKGSCST